MGQADGPPALITSVTGVALAGGLSRRMGRDKAALEISGQSLVAYVAARLRRVFVRVIISGPATLTALQPDTLVIPDAHPHLGPLGGLASALEAVETPWLFLAACDMPFIQPALVHHMATLALAARDAQAVALSSPRGPEPLHTLYRHNIGALVEESLASARPSMGSLLARLRVLEVPAAEMTRLDPQGLSTFNANTPEDWRHALELMKRDND